MKHFYLLIIIIISINIIGCTNKFPKPYGFVNDFAHIINENEYYDIINTVDEIHNEKHIQIAVVTLDSTHYKNQDFTTYVKDLGNNWGVGEKNKNNGVILAISESNKKVVIQVGTGIEKVLTDSICGEILKKEMIPEFKKGKFKDGIIKGLKKINSYFK